MFRKILLFCVLLTNLAFASKHNSPIGVMGDHIHKKGEVMGMAMVNYSTMKNIYGMSESETYHEYDSAPRDMAMKMYMYGLMYGITDKFNVMVMGQFMDMDMTNVSHEHHGMHVSINEDKHGTKGVGDTEITALYQIQDDSKTRIQANLGLVLPTGSINKTHTHEMHGMPHTMRASYMMQTGTGSYSVRPQFTFVNNFDTFEIGTQLGGTFRLNKNSNDYKFGDIYEITSWIGKNLNKDTVITGRLNYVDIQKIKGLDNDISQSNSPMGVPALQYRKQLTALAGVNYKITEKTKILGEVGVPMYQKTGDGMLKNRYSISIGIQQGF